MSKLEGNFIFQGGSTDPDAVTCDRMRLIGTKSGLLGPISHCLLEESQ